MLVEVESGFLPVKIGFGVFLRVALHLQSFAVRKRNIYQEGKRNTYSQTARDRYGCPRAKSKVMEGRPGRHYSVSASCISIAVAAAAAAANNDDDVVVDVVVEAEWMSFGRLRPSWEEKAAALRVLLMTKQSN